MSTERAKGSYGILPLHLHATPADQLYKQVVPLLGKHPSWQLHGLVQANQLAQETQLARATVTKAMSRLVTEGILSPHRGKGYRIVRVEPRPLATCLLSVTEFCKDAELELVSVLDHENCRAQPLSDIAVRQSRPLEFVTELTNRLNVIPSERLLTIRRIRGFKPKGSLDQFKWGILETMFLVERLLPNLEQFIKGKLEPIGKEDPLGNQSLHQWMTSSNIELERSEYSATLAKLDEPDAKAWDALRPRAHHASDDLFIRLSAVTYGKNIGPLLYTQEKLVPDMVLLGITDFRFLRGPGIAHSA